MARSAAILALMVLLDSGQALSGAPAQPGWLDRAPLNTDSSLVGLPAVGLGRAFRYLAYLYNAIVLAGLMYLLAKEEPDFGNFVYVFAGILASGIVLSVVLSPFIHAFSLVPIIALNTFLLARFCFVPVKRALLVALLYQAGQILFLVVYKLMEANYA